MKAGSDKTTAAPGSISMPWNTLASQVSGTGSIEGAEELAVEGDAEEPAEGEAEGSIEGMEVSESLPSSSSALAVPGVRVRSAISPDGPRPYAWSAPVWPARGMGPVESATVPSDTEAYRVT